MKTTKERRKYLSQEDVPAYSIEDALQIPRAIFDNFGKQSPPPLKVAGVLGVAPASTKFRMLCCASIAYGFTSGGYNAASIGIEPLAKRVLAPTLEGDDQAALRQAFLKPRINRGFVERYNNSPLPKEGIGVNVLIELGVPRERATSILQSIIASAEKLGMVQDIKGKKYLYVDASTEINITETGDSSVDVTNDARPQPRSLLPLISSTTPLGNGHPIPAAQTFVAKENGENRRVFITHGKNKAFVEPIKKLLTFGEHEAVVAVEKQTVSEPVPEKVMNDMRSCGAAIIHVEGEMKLVDATATEHVMLNPNVLIEIGAAMALFGSRFILLVKEGVKLPSNLSGLYCVRYAGETLDGDVTIRLLEAINELKKRPLVNQNSNEPIKTVQN